MATTLFTEELFEEILDLHAGKGDAPPETIRGICRREGMPKARTFYEWLDNNPDLQRRFKAARKVAMDGIADEIKDISDTPKVGEIQELERTLVPWTDEEKARDKENPGSVPLQYEEIVTKRTRKDMLEHRKLQVDARFKLLAKWDTARYGDKVQLDHGGSLNLTINDTPKP